MFPVVLGERRHFVGIVDKHAIMLLSIGSLRGGRKLSTIRVRFGGLARPSFFAGRQPPGNQRIHQRARSPPTSVAIHGRYLSRDLQDRIYRIVSYAP
ncbi:UNVERIFIED_ORG: hypothetical protein GGE53_000413 [Rhizobium etli]